MDWNLLCRQGGRLRVVTGCDQVKLTIKLGGTPLYEWIRDAALGHVTQRDVLRALEKNR